MYQIKKTITYVLINISIEIQKKIVECRALLKIAQ